jgi:uncharacterized protein (TIGR02001 family)
VRVILAALLLAPAAAARADDAPTKPVTLSGDATVVSDYLYRGVSLSSGRAELQGDATVLAPSGWYGSAFGSGLTYGGSREELDLSAGRRFSSGGFDYDVGLVRYSFFGARGLDYTEVPVSIARTMGDWTWTGALAYAPAQPGTLHRGNGYAALAGRWQPPHARIELDFHAGYEDGAFARRKVDWSLGGSVHAGKALLSLSQVGYADRWTRGTVLVTAGVGF